MAKPLVSAIIATHNYGHHLAHALDSILTQEGRGEEFEVEIIVVDDASTDATAQIIAQYPQVRYLQHTHKLGVSAARNTGIRAGTGQFVSFLDADDTWLPHKLRVQLGRLLDHPEVGVVYSQGIRRGAGPDRLFPDPAQAPSGYVFEAMLEYNFAVHGGCLLIRREALDQAGHFDESLHTAEDLDLAFRLAFHHQFLFVPVPVMVYNISPHGLWLTSAARGGAARDHGQVVERALRMLPDLPQYAGLREEAPIRIAMHAMSPFVLIGQLDQARTEMLAALRAHPSSGRYPWVRGRVKWVTQKLLLESASPMAQARELCDQIEAITTGGSFEERRSTRWILAEIWAVVMFSGPLRSRIGPRATAYAAIRAVGYAPSRRALLRRFGQGVASRFSRGRRK